jgi:hypothetical protein
MREKVPAPMFPYQYGQMCNSFVTASSVMFHDGPGHFTGLSAYGVGFFKCEYCARRQATPDDGQCRGCGAPMR